MAICELPKASKCSGEVIWIGLDEEGTVKTE